MNKVVFTYLPDDFECCNTDSFKFIGTLIGQHKIRYKKLITLVRVNHVMNVFIDLNPVWSGIISNESVIASCTSNTACIEYEILYHLMEVARHYIKFQSLHTDMLYDCKIIFLDTSDKYIANNSIKEVCNDYCARFKRNATINEKRSRKIVNLCKTYLKALTNISSHIVYHQEECGEHMLIPYVYAKDKTGNLNIIISSDRYIDMYVNENNFEVFIKLKSGMLYGKDLKDYYKISNKITANVLHNKVLFSLMQACCGNEPRGISNAIGMDRNKLYLYLESLLKQARLTKIHSLDQLDKLAKPILINGNEKQIPLISIKHAKLFNLEYLDSICQIDLQNFYKVPDQTLKKKSIQVLFMVMERLARTRTMYDGIKYVIPFTLEELHKM